MNETGKEILCTGCAHREVCERKNEYQHAAALANDIIEELMDRVHLQLRTIPWVHVRPPEVICDYFMRRRKMMAVWDNLKESCTDTVSGGTNE